MVWFCFNFVPYDRLINCRYPAGQKEVLTWIASSLEIYFLNHCHQFLLLSIKCLWGSCESHEFLKKSWNLHSYFPELEKVWKIEVKSGKMVIFIFIRGILLNQSFFFSFSKLQQLPYKLFFIVLVKSYSISRVYCSASWKKLCSYVFEVCIDSLFDNLGSRKKLFFFYYYFRYEPRALLDSRAVSVELKEYVLKS